MTPLEASFDYDLPRELIAQQPLKNRADARLMVVNRTRQSIDHFHVRDLPEILRSGDRLVLNNTRVIPARLVGKRTATGGQWQGLFLSVTDDGFWRLVQKTRGHIRPGEAVTLLDRDNRPSAQLLLAERCEGGQWLARPVEDEPAFQLLNRIGRVPLPPYIRGGNMVDADVERYQTVFARHSGAVAAPTAGLHFTRPLLQRLAKRGCAFSTVTLHVGLDTFRPITAPSLDDHRMHQEWCELTAEEAEQVNQVKESDGRVVAVGTTAVRVLETAASDQALDSERRITPSQAVVRPFSGQTDLFIRPPYTFRAVGGLLTNFHFPRTTLLVLVSTFAGRDLMQRCYEEAVRQRYRFYSYGDAMLIL